MKAVSLAGAPADIRWLTPARAQDGPGLAAWCAGVGPAVLLDGVPEAEPRRTDSLVVVTWNVHVGGGDVMGLVRDLRAGRFTDGQPVESFVLLLQEGYRSGPEVPTAGPEERTADLIAETPPSGERLDVVRAARLLGLHLFYAPSMRNGEGHEDRGNAILSTLPLTGATALELPLEMQRRVVVAGTVNGLTRSGRRWTLRVASVHLAHRSPWSRFADSFGAGRTRQARVVARELVGDAVALGGDLNTWSASEMEDAPWVLRESFPAAAPDPEPTFTVAGVLRKKLDYLMFRLPSAYEAAPVRRIDDQYGSDHYPLISVVHLAS